MYQPVGSHAIVKPIHFNLFHISYLPKNGSLSFVKLIGSYS